MSHPTRSTDMPDRKVALLAGVFFILTFVTSIPALLLYGPVLDDPAYVLTGGVDTQIQIGALLEVFLVIANIVFTLAVAGWMRYVYGEDEQGRPIAVSDPLAPQFAAIAARHRGDPAAFAQGLLGLRAIFDEDLHNEPRFSTPVTGWLMQLFAQGAAKTVARAVA